MSPAMEVQIAGYQAMPAQCLEVNIAALESCLRRTQKLLAAARKAQKNQKRAAKDRKKVVG